MNIEMDEGFKLIRSLKISDMQSLKDEITESTAEGLERVYLNGKYGYISYINNKREELIPLKYDYIGNFHEGLAKVKLNGKWGYINNKGEEVISPKYDYAGDFHEGLAAVRLNGEWRYINNRGEEVISPKYNYVGDFHEGLAVVELNGKYGYINNKGEEVISLKYDDAGDFHEGLAPVLYKRKEFIDNTGHIIEELGYLCKLNGVTYIGAGKQLFQISIDGVKFMVPLEYIKSLNFIEKISVNEFNSKNIEKIKTIMDKCKKAQIVEEYYDLNINGKILSFKTAEAREAALKQIDFTDTTKGRQYIKIL